MSSETQRAAITAASSAARFDATAPLGRIALLGSVAPLGSVARLGSVAILGRVANAALRMEADSSASWHLEDAIWVPIKIIPWVQSNS